MAPQGDLGEPRQVRSREGQQWKTFPTEDMKGCEDLHSTVARGLLLHTGQNPRETAIKRLSFRYSSGGSGFHSELCYKGQKG